MSTAYTGNLKLLLNKNGSITVIQEGESWGDPWPAKDSSITISDIRAFQSCLSQLTNEHQNKW